MNRQIYYDHIKDRLVYISEQPSIEYWNNLWSPSVTSSIIKQGNRFVTSQTKKFLPLGSRVVDAGCGIGATVYGLKEAGFDAYGIDNAVNTINKIKNIFPEIQISNADVKKTSFENNFFDGLWSLGVIEHFYDGYEEIINETHRIIKNDGYLFLTVPSISPLKRLKINFKQYKNINDANLDNFFQYSFSQQETINKISKMGFKFIKSSGISGAFGFSEDLPLLSRAICINPNKTGKLSKVLWRASDFLLTSFSFHTAYFIFQKKCPYVSSSPETTPIAK